MVRAKSFVVVEALPTTHTHTHTQESDTVPLGGLSLQQEFSVISCNARNFAACVHMWNYLPSVDTTGHSFDNYERVQLSWRCT